MQLTECPRDAMQGIETFIPTNEKIAYLNKLLSVGFDILDAGSFVSPKAIPQMADTSEVLDNLIDSNTDILTIVANIKGVELAVAHQRVDILGYPLSVSETFQQRNTNKTIEQAIEDVLYAQEVCGKKNKSLCVYLSMAFGNPYGEAIHDADLLTIIKRLASNGITNILLADTIGSATVEQVHHLPKIIHQTYPEVSLGIHLHASPDHVDSKVKNALEANYHRIDTAIGGLGGCPMAKDDLTGNIPTEKVVQIAQEINSPFMLNMSALDEAIIHSRRLFQNYIS